MMSQIKEQLDAKGKTSDWLADKMQCRRDHVRDWLENEAQPNFETVIRMAETCGLAVKVFAD